LGSSESGHFAMASTIFSPAGRISSPYISSHYPINGLSASARDAAVCDTAPFGNS
jgi:hypothetical protein